MYRFLIYALLRNANLSQSEYINIKHECLICIEYFVLYLDLTEIAQNSIRDLLQLRISIILRGSGAVRNCASCTYCFRTHLSIVLYRTCTNLSDHWYLLAAYSLLIPIPDHQMWKSRMVFLSQTVVCFSISTQDLTGFIILECIYRKLGGLKCKPYKWRWGRVT
jgi:hypothetical protein